MGAGECGDGWAPSLVAGVPAHYRIVPGRTRTIRNVPWSAGRLPSRLFVRRPRRWEQTMALRCDDQGLQDQVRVVQVDPLADPRWGSFVAQHPDALIYHHPAWLSALEQEYQRRPLGLVCEDGAGAIRGVLALCHTRGVPFRAGGQLSGRRLSPLPRTRVSGQLALDRQAAAALVQAAVDRARLEPGTQLQLK